MTTTNLIITIILLASLSTVAVNMAFAEPVPGAKSTQGYPYVDPIREYYDNKMANAVDITKAKPVYYQGFYIQPLREISCDQWTPVYGIVPKDGILTFTIHSGNAVVFSNVSHNYQFWLINYFYLPCEGIESTATLGVYFIYNDSTDQEIYPDTKVKDLGFTSGAMFLQQTFNVHG